MALTNSQISRLAHFTKRCTSTTPTPVRVNATSAPTPLNILHVARAANLALSGDIQSDASLLRSMLHAAVVQLGANAADEESAKKHGVPEEYVIRTGPPPTKKAEKQRVEHQYPLRTGLSRLKKEVFEQSTFMHNVQRHSRALLIAFEKRNVAAVNNAFVQLGTHLFVKRIRP
ncbi:hypothetical protein Tdes44962_MAKER03149 [Teratosphaeria destructans]|uniref:Uncharacterized protein n=1 Tax=Teratosphaeria destructans TaxID=418781 RepID=A0A9W7SR04_9PEZI|nr:hypothetical protein Tdes44962_MAKER03149 [Teratosphaeria destructans]